MISPTFGRLPSPILPSLLVRPPEIYVAITPRPEKNRADSVSRDSRITSNKSRITRLPGPQDAAEAVEHPRRCAPDVAALERNREVVPVPAAEMVLAPLVGFRVEE